jgi:D-alanyl-D-alanine carboxypeptidase
VSFSFFLLLLTVTDGYHSLMAKAFGGPAVSMTLTQRPTETESLANDPRAEVLNAVYCPK